MNTQTPIIRAKNVVKSWGKTPVLTDMTVDFQPGITGFLGSNGAGKTTFMSLVLGVDQRDSGELSVFGADPDTAGPEVRALIGYSPEHHHLPPEVQAYDFVKHMAQLHGLAQHASTERASDALWLVGLGEERMRPMGTMSTGQRQRVKLAAAIAHDPNLVLLDEPTDGLDPVQRDDMLDLIKRIGNLYKINIVLSSHLLHEIEQICDHVVIIDSGRVTKAASLDTIGYQQESNLEIEIDGGHDVVAAQLQSFGIEVTRSGSRLRIQDRRPQGCEPHLNDLVRDVVASAQVGLRRMVAHRVTLEDVFIESAITPSIRAEGVSV